MRVRVLSEIDRLRRVLVHAPGREVDNMPPALMEQLLFDDILYGPRARMEHGRFRAVLERLDVEVDDTRDLLETALAAAPAGIPALLESLRCLEDPGDDVLCELAALEPGPLADALIHGLVAPPEEAEPDDLFRLAPIPNLLFTRDPQVVLGTGVVISAMSRRARQREPLLSRFVFEHHPELSGTPVLVDYQTRRQGRAWPRKPSTTLEGGDILIFREGIVLVGVSERTMERAVDRLIEQLRLLGELDRLIMVPMPRQRSAMHLDTIFTRTSEDECLVYPPLVLPGGPETLSVISVDLRDPDDWGRRRPSLLDALAEAGVKLKPICCGGQNDYIQQTREQWTDGANSFAVRPGVVMIYSRNRATAEELDRNGYHVVSIAEMRFDEDGSCLYRFEDGKKYALLVAGEELSRARGGPRCMTMPLLRDTR